MTSKLVVNTIEADTGISSVSFASSISMDSTSKFHFSAAGVDIGADTNISRPAAGVLGFNISGAEKLRIDTNGHLNTSGIVTAANFKSGVTNVHNLGVTLAGGQLDVGSNIKIGTAGVVTATSFVGSGANLTSLPTQITINNNSNGRVITATGNANELDSQANLTFSNSSNDPKLTITGSGHAQLFLTNTSGADHTGVNFGDSADTNAGMIQYSNSNNAMQFHTNGTEKLRITSDGKLGINYAGTPPSEDVMICTAGQASPAGLTLSHLSGGNRYGARLQTISGTNRGLIISELFNSSYSDLAKVNTEFGLKADNTCKAWLCYRSEAGSEQIQDDFNVSSVNDEGTGTFGVNLEVNVHRHGNGFYQSIVFGCYNDGSRPLIASVGYAPSHGSNNPWWDVEDNFVRVQTQRSDNGTVLDAKVFSMAMFGDTSDLSPT